MTPNNEAMSRKSSFQSNVTADRYKFGIDLISKLDFKRRVDHVGS